MKSVNLIPAPRVAAKLRRVHVRRCFAGCCAWAVICAAAAGGYRLFSAGVDANPGERMAAVTEEIERTERAIAGVRIQLAAAQSTLRANQAIANQPDWSVLLALLASKIGDDVVLRSCHVHPAGSGSGPARRPDAPRTAPPAVVVAAPAGNSPAAAPVEVAPFVLEADGIARTQVAAHRFVRDLELTGFFGRVTLVRTNAEPYLNESASAFKLECSLDAPPEVASGQPSGPTGNGQNVSAQASVEEK